MPNAHTPGPWALSDEDSPLISAADGTYIAQVFSRNNCEIGNLRQNYAADATLIAAAPDLLEALYVAKRALAEAMQPHLVPGLRNEYDIVAAAINKATGA